LKILVEEIYQDKDKKKDIQTVVKKIDDLKSKLKKK
jgi:hypothetical protein